MLLSLCSMIVPELLPLQLAGRLSPRLAEVEIEFQFPFLGKGGDMQINQARTANGVRASNQVHPAQT